MKKQTRKQPRSKTPPLVLHDHEGNVDAIEVDQDLTTTRWMTSGHVNGYLQLGPRLRVILSSRSVNKHRRQVLIIYPVSNDDPDPSPPDH